MRFARVVYCLAVSACCFSLMGTARGEYFPGDDYETGVSSANGTFVVNFYYLNAGSGFDMNSDFRRDFQNSIMRAMNTIENTFRPASSEAVSYSRGIHVSVWLQLDPNGNPGAASVPSTGFSKKETWDANDFGGRGEGQKASVNNVEALLKYGERLDQQVDRPDAGITFTGIDAAFGYFYVGENPAGRPSYQRDVESLTLHEMGHVLGFNAGSTGTTSALEVLSVPNGGQYGWTFTGDTTMQLTGEKGVKLHSGTSAPDGHIMKDGDYPYVMLTGADALSNPSDRRTYSERELAMFKDMGYTLADDPFEPAVPEPSSAALALLGLLGIGMRRRR